MINNHSNKKKLKLLGVGAALCLFLCYEFAIRKTIQEYSLHNKLIEGSDTSPIPRMSMEGLQTRNAKISELYNRYLLDTTDNERNLLSIAGNFSKENNLRLKEYRPISRTNGIDRQLLTRIIKVEGSFVSCLRLLFLLETGKNGGRVGSAEFKSYKDESTKHIKLDCTIFVQNSIPY